MFFIIFFKNLSSWFFFDFSISIYKPEHKLSFMNTDNLKDLLEKYKSGKCSEEELDYFLSFIKDKEKEDLLTLLFNDETDCEIIIHAKRSSSTSASSWFSENRIQISLVASIVLSLIISSLVYYNISSPLKDSTSLISEMSFTNKLVLNSGEVISLDTVLNNPKVLVNNNQIRIVQNSLLEISLFPKAEKLLNDYDLLALHVGKGNRLKVNFFDGSSVWVNSDSELKFPAQFADDKRVVELIGEGYFDIMHAKTRPFYVKTTEQIIKVYGTRFNLRNYKNEDRHTVFLYEGKLSVKNQDNENNVDEILLSPGEEARLFRSTDFIEKKIVNTPQDSATWISGNKKYDKALLRDIFLDISHKYDVKIDWENIPKLHFTGKFSDDMTVNETIAVLSKTAGIRINYNNNKITF